ncbi:GcrA family cell cycle regulator [uncultured Phenylobacterium sp.]|uniref:GcrA family cell cycle regulator n=1 Tax=uncultured Phenylobacterium sp. TaxID=349273 RepID=UPI0025CBB28E|nr:GcrA family cell cycle regulator [uncultured Phenylobacterium sp.]
MSATSTWTDDRVQTLSRLWQEGASASQIARNLGGVTRNAVIGKIHRLGLSGRAAPSAPGARRAKPKREQRLRPRYAAAPPRLVAPPEIGLANVVSIQRGQCRWPMGDPLAEDFCLCGRKAVRGAYCDPHGALAYRPTDRDHLLKLARLG